MTQAKPRIQMLIPLAALLVFLSALAHGLDNEGGGPGEAAGGFNPSPAIPSPATQSSCDPASEQSVARLDARLREEAGLLEAKVARPGVIVVRAMVRNSSSRLLRAQPMLGDLSSSFESDAAFLAGDFPGLADDLRELNRSLQNLVQTLHPIQKQLTQAASSLDAVLNRTPERKQGLSQAHAQAIIGLDGYNQIAASISGLRASHASRAGSWGQLLAQTAADNSAGPERMARAEAGLVRINHQSSLFNRIDLGRSAWDIISRQDQETGVLMPDRVRERRQGLDKIANDLKPLILPAETAQPLAGNLSLARKALATSEAQWRFVLTESGSGQAMGAARGSDSATAAAWDTWAAADLLEKHVDACDSATASQASRVSSRDDFAENDESMKGMFPKGSDLTNLSRERAQDLAGFGPLIENALALGASPESLKGQRYRGDRPPLDTMPEIQGFIDELRGRNMYFRGPDGRLHGTPIHPDNPPDTSRPSLRDYVPDWLSTWKPATTQAPPAHSEQPSAQTSATRGPTEEGSGSAVTEGIASAPGKPIISTLSASEALDSGGNSQDGSGNASHAQGSSAGGATGGFSIGNVANTAFNASPLGTIVNAASGAAGIGGGAGAGDGLLGALSGPLGMAGLVMNGMSAMNTPKFTLEQLYPDIETLRRAFPAGSNLGAIGPTGGGMPALTYEQLLGMLVRGPELQHMTNAGYPAWSLASGSSGRNPSARSPYGPNTEDEIIAMLEDMRRRNIVFPSPYRSADNSGFGGGVFDPTERQGR